MKKTTKRKLELGREVVKKLDELKRDRLEDVQGGLRFNTGCTDVDSGCGIATYYW